jgi:outer membrane protein TolC
LPTVSLEGRDEVDQNQGLNFDPVLGFTTQAIRTNRYGGGLKGDLNLFHFGGDFAAMRGANAEEDAQSLAVTDTMLKAEGSGAQAIDAVIQANKDVEILRRIKEMREGILSIARERFRRGLLAEQEVQKVSVDLDNDAAQLRDAEAEVIRTRADLVALLGHDRIQLEWPWLDRLRAGTPDILRVPDTALSKRPDWRSAEAKVKGTRERQTQNLAQVLPSLDFNFSYGLYHTETLGQTVSGPELSAAVVLSVPLFDRLSNYGNYAAQIQAVSLAELDLEKVRRTARAQWEQAKGALEISLQTARDRDRTLEISRQLYQDNLMRFQKGLVTANDVSIDQARLFQSERLDLQGWNAAHGNFVRLCNALGRRIKDCWQ